MLFMLSYKAYPGKGAEALELRQQWQEKYSGVFRKQVKVVHEFTDPSSLVGCLLLEMDNNSHLGSLLPIQSVFGDAVEFNLNPVIDMKQALEAGMEEPAGLL